MAKTVMSELVVRMTAETAALKAEMERVRRSVDTAAKNMSAEFAKSQKSVDSLAGGFKALGGIIAGVGFGALIQKIGQVSDNIAMFERGIRVISPSLADAGKSMEFVSRLANQMGLGLQDVREGFIDLAAATQGTVLAGEETRKIFESVTRFGDMLGKSAERIKLGFLGISQMATLQTVSMEETRQVMENLGVSMTTIAKSIGMTTQQYKENVKAGKVMASDLLPALAKKMDELTAKAGATARTFGAAWKRMKNDWELFLNAVAQSGLVDTLASAFKAMAAAIKSAQQPVVDFIRTLVSLKAEIGLVVAALGTMFIISKVTAGFIALQAAIAGAAGVTAALTSLNAVAAVAFGPAGWIALGVGLLAGLVMNMNALKGQTVQLVGALSQADRMKTATTNIQEAKARMAELNKEYENLIVLENANRNANQRSNPRIAQIQEELKTLQETIDRFSGAETRWTADLAEGERLAAEESARLKKELAELNEEQGKAGKAAKDTRSELEKLNVPYAKLIEQYSELYGVAPKVTAAVMQAESAFKQFASSGKAYGLMQLIPSTFSDMLGNAAKDIYNVNQNIQAGTKYLGILIKQFGDLPKALAAYNAGPGRVMQAVNIATKEGITWQEAFAKTFPKAWKETGPYIQRVLGYLTEFGDGKYEIDAMADAQKEAAEAAKLHDEALGRLDESLAKLEEQTRAYAETLQQEAQAAKDALLQAQDPEAYKEMVRAREQLKAQDMAGMYDQEAQAALRSKYAAEDALESLQMRQGWANSILQGFDQLWSNMIGGAENAMEALQKTLKSWLYAIGQWLLKQTLIIPITAALFGVSQKSLGGGILGQLGGAGQTGGGGMGGMFSNLGSFFGGYSIAGGIQDLLHTLGEKIPGAIGNALAGTTVGLPNWGFGAAGIAGGLIGSQFGGYGGFGGSLGGMGGAMLGQALIPVPVLGAAIGAALGSLGGGFLGGLFGKEEKITGGTAYWNPKQGAGAAHGDTDQAVVGLMGEFGKLADSFNAVINQISGRSDNLFGGGFWMDTNSKGQISTAYNSWLRGVQKASFTQQEEAAKWLANQMLHDVTIAMRNIGGGIDEAVQGIFSNLTNQMTGDTNAALQALAEFAEKFPALQQMLKDTLPKLSQPLRDEFTNIAKWNAKSIEDVAAILTMAQDVQSGYADSLWQVFQGTKAIQGANEDLLSAYQRGAAQFVEWRNALVLLGGPVLRMTQDTIVWSDQMAKAAGGLENLQQLHSTYFENFYTDEERALAARKLAQADIDKFNQTLGRTGEAALDTRDELRQYVEGLDLGTEAGRNAYVAALRLAEAIMTLDPVANAAGEAIAELATTLAQFTQKQLAPGTDVGQQESRFFENFYTEAERTAASVAEWTRQIAEFNATLGLSGDAAIDTTGEFRAYIESLDTTTDAGREAYIAAMKLVEALLGLKNAGDASADAVAETARQLNELMASVRDTIAGAMMPGDAAERQIRQMFADISAQYLELWEQAKALGAGEKELSEIRLAAIIDMGNALSSMFDAASAEELQAMADVFARNFDELRRWLSELGYGAVEIQAYLSWIQNELGTRLKSALEDALQAAIDKVAELKVAWMQFQLDIEDRIGRLYGGTGVSPDSIWKMGEQMYRMFEANWANMSNEQRLGAVNQMVGMIDQWVSASVSAIDAAANKQIEAINTAADAQIEALNNNIDAMQEARDKVAEQYDEQIDALNDILDELGDWVNVVESIKSMLEQMRYGGVNPLASTVQMASLNADIQRLMAQFTANPTADLAQEMIDLLQTRMSMAQQIYQRSDPKYMALYNETLGLLEFIKSLAPPDVDRVEEIQDEIKRLTEEQTDVLKAMDDNIEAARKAAEDQIKAINDSREAQIKAVQDSAESQKNAIYDTAKELYEGMKWIGDMVYEAMLKDADAAVKIAQQQLDTLRQILLAITGGALAPPLNPEDDGYKIFNPNMYAIQQSIMDEIGSAQTLAELEAVSLKWLPLIDQMGEFYRAQGYSQQSIEEVWRQIEQMFYQQMALLSQTMAKVDALTYSQTQMPSYQNGIAYVPQDGPAYLHRGEKVTPAHRGDQVIHIHLFEHANISGDPVVIRKTINDMLPKLKQDLKRTIG